MPAASQTQLSTNKLQGQLEKIIINRVLFPAKSLARRVFPTAGNSSALVGEDFFHKTINVRKTVFLRLNYTDRHSLCRLRLRL